MKIIVDAFGGDNAPIEVMKAAAEAVNKLGVEIILVGDSSKIKDISVREGISLKYIEILDAPDVFDIHTEPTEIMKSGKNTSMAVGLRALSESKGDAFVSAGSTGALIVGATFIVKRIKNIKRPAFSPIFPTGKGHFILLDAGANLECRPEMLAQFAVMGSVYMHKIMQIPNPVIKLVNVGEEYTKGRDCEKGAYKILKNSKLNFRGNIEARDIPIGGAQVIVTDGFTGNIILKLYEGMAKYFGNSLKNDVFTGYAVLGGLIAKPKLNQFKKSMDYKEVGGAILLGVRKTVIKAHGSSDAKAFYNAIRQAKSCVEAKIVDTISEEIGKLDLSLTEMRSNENKEG